MKRRRAEVYIRYFKRMGVHVSMPKTPKEFADRRDRLSRSCATAIYAGDGKINTIVPIAPRF